MDQAWVNPPRCVLWGLSPGRYGLQWAKPATKEGGMAGEKGTWVRGGELIRLVGGCESYL
jgi:hypothetical protein